MNLPYSNPKHRTREELFFDFYSRLLDWAFQLVHHDQAEAEDLVHDLYIQFVRVDRTIEKIENIEAYLFTTLRNLYYSRMRRAGHDPLNDFSIVDYDSVELGLAAVDRRQLLYVRSNLKQVCRYACQRKSAARSASILILRFFFGYYPSEVMKITQASRMAVDRSLQLARKEARQNLERPNAVQPIVPGKEISVSFGAADNDSENLFAQLREAIFSSREGECFAEGILEQRYAAERDSGFTTPELAHLVSCRLCLDRANSILGLPLLSERSPEDALDHDTHSNSDGDGGASGATGEAKQSVSFKKKARQRERLERRVRQFFEHRPASLQIAVNGEIRASQIVTSEVSELYLKLGRSEQPSFIEVLSEQGLCLVYFQVEQPAYTSGLAQSQSITLSEDRTLHLSLSFATDVPIVHVVYRDPVMAEATAEDSIAKSVADNAQAGNLPFATTVPSRPILLDPLNRLRRWAGRLIAWLAGHSKDLLVLGKNPLLVGGIAIAIAMCVWIWPSKSPPMSAIALLQHAEVSEAVPFSAARPQVIYEKVRIKTAKLSIERSIYRDTSGRRKQRAQPVDPQSTALETSLANAGVNWNEPLSAATYQDWRDHVQVTEDAVQETGNNLLTLTTTVSDAEVAQESLTVRESDFHPVARTISFRDTGKVEIAELDYKVLPWNTESETWFEPLVSSDMVPVHPSLQLPVSGTLSENQLDEAELSVRLVLNHLHADTGEQIEVVRGSHGIDVRGIAATEERKHELEAQLHMLPHVTASISSIEELKAKPLQTGGPSGAEVIEMQTQRTPLRSYYLAHGRNTSSLGDLSQQLYDCAFAVNQESKAIDDLEHRFSRSDNISTVASVALTELLFTHKHKLLEALEEEQQLLNSAQIEATPGNQDVPINSTDSLLATLAERNRALTWDLAVGKGGEGRSAETLASELATSINALQIRAHQVQIGPQNSMSADKRR